ncbi:MAG TPA: alanine--tRNA ligase [Syntrophales bacterium]|nr:alanine--tRNA ligase [Syntrophales bacterium]HOM06099.1 alanine--tRNA ligase [Syntrophales bacterium]HPQ05582.1 alanine--tRNA ligase [Syntrophales bacterium]
MAMTSSEIREKFLRYFEERGHTVVPSSSLIPKDDPTLLFTNSGMVQFKNCFLGLEDRGYTRAASSQKSVRAGGKHNDLENVGYTARHHTFFEMLGNFSFGDYFKRESISWGWDFLTRVMAIPKERLWITIYKDDDEAFEIWHREIGIPAERIVRMGMDSNFWMMGETGPCGPCSEIIYDQGPGVGCGRPDCSVECDCDRHLELWNHVFTQFDRDKDGNFHPLPKPNIDTGMGLERLAAVVQGVMTNYDTDLFQPIIQAIAGICGKRYGENPDSDVSMRVIADHSRAVTFLIGDGCLPSNEGRGYVLRRILRRAARHGKLLGLERPFLNEVVSTVVAVMRDAYPDLVDKESYIRKVVVNEEQRFIETLDTGMRILTEEVAELKKTGRTVIPGEVVFRLYDTYGFPVDLTADIVRKDNLTLDMEGFEKAMEAQREKARESWKGSGEEAVADAYKRLSVKGVTTDFIGYHGVVEASSPIRAILKGDQEVDEVREGDNAEIFVAETPFYGEKGGQVGDTGVIEGDGFLFEVWDTQWPLDNLITHIGKVRRGTVRVGDTALLKVDEKTRRATEANHSGTHVLNAALRRVLGDHVKQSGSLVTPERLRFDFTHFSRIEDEELERIEAWANEFIRCNAPVDTRILPKEEAMKTGAAAVFDEKYGDSVRLVKMGDFSMELCGGTHVNRTGDIGMLKVVAESSVAAGVRRIEALTGEEAVKYLKKVEGELKRAAHLLRAGTFEVADRVEKLQKHQRELEKEIEALKGKLAARDSADLISRAKEIKGVRVLAAEVEAEDVKTMRDLGDKLRDRLRSGIVLLGSRVNGKAMLLCMVTKDLTDRYRAGDIVKALAPVVGGSGGGRPDMAQAGGPLAEKIPEALAGIETLI